MLLVGKISRMRYDMMRMGYDMMIRLMVGSNVLMVSGRMSDRYLLWPVRGWRGVIIHDCIG